MPRERPSSLRTDTVLAVDQHPNGGHPLIKPESGILEDRPNLDGELFLASLAKPQQASLDEVVFGVAASRTHNFLVGPSQVDGIHKSPFWIGEVNDGVLQSLRRLHV